MKTYFSLTAKTQAHTINNPTPIFSMNEKLNGFDHILIQKLEDTMVQLQMNIRSACLDLYSVTLSTTAIAS